MVKYKIDDLFSWVYHTGSGLDTCVYPVAVCDRAKVLPEWLALVVSSVAFSLNSRTLFLL